LEYILFKHASPARNSTLLSNAFYILVCFVNFLNIFVDLRKQARQLENDIDLKLISFSKFGTSYSNHRDGLR